MKKSFWPIFSRIIECDKFQGTLCKGPQGIPAITVQVVRSVLQDLLKWLLKTRSFEKTGNISSEEKILAKFFLVLSSVTSVRESKKINCLGPRRLLKTQFFQKYAIFPAKRNN